MMTFTFTSTYTACLLVRRYIIIVIVWQC